MLEDVVDETPDVDSWAQTLKRIAAEQKQHKGQEATGRGTRRRAAAAPLFPQVGIGTTMQWRSIHGSLQISPQQTLNLDDLIETSPQRRRSGSRSSVSEFSSYSDGSVHEGSDESVDLDMAIDLEDQTVILNRQDRLPSSQLVQWSTRPMDSLVVHTPPRRVEQSTHHGLETDDNYCGLCGSTHADECSMLKSPENLVEYRQLLLAHEDDESLEDRVCFGVLPCNVIF